MRLRLEKSGHLRGRKTAAMVIAALLFITGPLGAAEVSVEKSEAFDPSAIKRVAFLPLVTVLPVEEGQRPLCPLSKRAFDACRIEDAAQAELSRIIGQALLDSGAPVSWVPQAEINAAKDKLKNQGAENLNQHGSWQMAIGREVKADAVLLGFIYCYRERSGTAYASSAPAALAFCLHLVDPSSGKVLWSLRYADEQVPLSNNLLDLSAYIKRKGKFISVAQMAEEAAAQIVLQLPWTANKDKTGRQ